MIILIAVVSVVLLALIIRARSTTDTRSAVFRWCRVACLPLWLMGTVSAVWSSWGTASPGWLIGVLLVPTALCLLASLLPAGRFRGGFAWTHAGLLLLFVTLTGFSVGLFYLPAALAVLAAATVGSPGSGGAGADRSRRPRIGVKES